MGALSRRLPRSSDPRRLRRESAITVEEFHAFELGVPGPIRDRLVALVVHGEKRATTSLLDQWRAAGQPLPRPGERCALVDSAGRPVAIVELTTVEVIRLDEADLSLALDEGEGFSSVEEWRAAHEQFWRAEILPQLGDAMLHGDTRIVVQRFRLLSARGEQDRGGATPPPAGRP